MWSKIAAVAVAAVFTCAVLALLWTTPKDAWSYLHLAHKVFWVGKFGIMVGVGAISIATWMWCKFANRPTQAE
jgi:hypothetical protein